MAKQLGCDKYIYRVVEPRVSKEPLVEIQSLEKTMKTMNSKKIRFHYALEKIKSVDATHDNTILKNNKPIIEHFTSLNDDESDQDEINEDRILPEFCRDRETTKKACCKGCKAVCTFKMRR